MLIAVLAATALTLACMFIHYEALRLTSRLLPRLRILVRFRVAVAVLACLASHIVQVTIFAMAYIALAASGAGGLAGLKEGGFADYLYFSLTAYSTLGFGDLSPQGAFRLVSGMEALLGLFLIAWSATFTYLVMERFWPLHTRVDRPDDSAH